jgi:recombination protein U
MYRTKGKNINMANKGMNFEREVEAVNRWYERTGQALIQKISTPWRVNWKDGEIKSAAPKGKSTLDFRGTIKGGMSISFDCKESEDDSGLPLTHILPHQIEYMRKAIAVNEITFILCSMKKQGKRFYIPGEKVIEYWDRWKENKGRRGYNNIPSVDMREIEFNDDMLLDYLEIFR